MKWLYFLFFVGLAHGFVLEDARVERANLDSPDGLRVSVANGSFFLTWHPVTSDDPADPVLGYKVKVWERALEYEYIDAVNTLVEDVEVVPDMSRAIAVPDGKPSKEYITEQTSAVVENIKFNVVYTMGVQAYTKTTEGPFTLRIIILPKSGI